MLCVLLSAMPFGVVWMVYLFGMLFRQETVNDKINTFFCYIIHSYWNECACCMYVFGAPVAIYMHIDWYSVFTLSPRRSSNVSPYRTDFFLDFPFYFDSALCWLSCVSFHQVDGFFRPFFVAFFFFIIHTCLRCQPNVLLIFCYIRFY